MRVASRTDKGKVRASNQDALLLQPGEFGLYGVADGMGGHNGGDVASRMAVLLLGRVLEGARPDESLLRGGMEEVNQMIFEEQQKDAPLRGMGTTMTVLWEDTARILIGHVGDSRAYRMHRGRLEQITQDHSMVGELVRSGLLTPEEAQRHPYRNVITRALGTGAEIETDILTLEKQPGDKYLLCSDGLTEYVRREEMQEILQRTPNEEAADRLLEMALAAGGRDNISLVIAEVTA